MLALPPPAEADADDIPAEPEDIALDSDDEATELELELELLDEVDDDDAALLVVPVHADRIGRAAALNAPAPSSRRARRRFMPERRK